MPGRRRLSHALLAATLACAMHAGDAPPNILWIVTEDHSARYMGAYGDPLALTPHFDRLAREGVLFKHAYATSPVCAPTRASIITGMYAPALGTQHMRCDVPMPGWLRYFPAYLRDAGYYTTNNAKTDYNAAVLPGTWDENGRDAHWRNRPGGKPFFSVVNIFASHESSLHKRLPLETDPAAVRVPAYLPDTPEVRADVAQYHDRAAAADREIGIVLAQLEADGLADSTIVFSYSDHGGVLPRSKRFLYENGTHVSLVVRFPEKFAHLAPSAPGSRSGELVNLVDLAPTVLSLAGIEPPVHMQGRAFAGPARAPAPAFTHNFRGRMDERIDFSRAVTDGRWRYIRNYRPELPAMQHLDYLWRQASMREWDRLNREGGLDAVQASFFQARDPEELFDCHADPDNVRNLASDPAHRDTLRRLRAANRAHLLRIRDTGFMPEALLRELSAGESPTKFSHDDRAYPLARIVDLVDRLQLGEAPPPDVLRASLADPLPAVRYWAALASLRARESVTADLVPLLGDRTPSVRLAAAFALARHGEGDAAWPVFAAALRRDEDPNIRLEALNYLALLPERPGSLDPLIQAAIGEPTTGENYVARAAEYLLGR